MNKGVFFQRIKYHYKRFLSILFASLGLALVVGALTYYLMAYQSGISLTILNYLILLAAFIMILVGAIKGTAVAYSGVLTFIFYILWDFGSYVVSYSMMSVLSGDWYEVLINSLYLGGSVAALIVGIFLYVRLRQFLVGRYASYVGLRNLALAFTILAVLFNAITPVLLVYLYAGSEISFVTIFLSVLDPLAVICEALASFFVITRLKSEY